jgi:vancomycin resistance protein YoaR
VVVGERLGGATREEAERRLTQRARELLRAPLHLRLGNKSATSTAAELGLELRVDESVSRALAVGRRGSTWSDVGRYLRSWWSDDAVPGAVSVDRARFDETLAKLEAALIEDPPFAGAITVENGSARLAAPRSGRKLAPEALLSASVAALEQGRAEAELRLEARASAPTLAAGSAERALSIVTRALSRPTVLEADGLRLEVTPVELGALLESTIAGNELVVGLVPARLEGWLASRRATLEKPPQDARFEVSSRDDVRVVPGSPGVKLPTELVTTALWSAAQSEAHRGQLPLVHEPLPARSTEQAAALGIKQLVASFTTRHPCCQPRVENIHRIAELLDGVVVEPGQTVSLNALVGPRTVKNGFVLAPSIEDGEMVDTVGGGVSQFATTIFNALLHGGYDIIERQPHTYWFPRYPMGYDATLGIPRPDIVFKNDSSAGLLVKTSATGTSVTVKLYGDNGGRRVVTSVSERREIVQPGVELLPNRAVEPDEEKVKEGGMIGWSVTTTRTVSFPDGTKKEEKRKVTYKPKVRRVEVHPCRIPKGELGATGEPCPEPEPEPTEETGAGAEQAAAPP